MNSVANLLEIDGIRIDPDRILIPGIPSARTGSDDRDDGIDQLLQNHTNRANRVII
jgi:hypothetical protein